MDALCEALYIGDIKYSRRCALHRSSCVLQAPCCLRAKRIMELCSRMSFIWLSSTLRRCQALTSQVLVGRGGVYPIDRRWRRWGGTKLCDQRTAVVDLDIFRAQVLNGCRRSTRSRWKSYECCRACNPTRFVPSSDMSGLRISTVAI